MKNYIIYALIDPRTNYIRYIGLTTIGFKRIKAHMKEAVLKNRATSQHMLNWLLSLAKDNLTYEVEILEENHNSIDELKQAEIFWIAYHRMIGSPLINMTDGGDGCHNRVVTDTFRKKMSEINTGKKLSEKTKDKLRESQKKKKVLCITDNIEFLSLKAAERHYMSGNISKVCNGKRLSARGKKFKFV